MKQEITTKETSKKKTRKLIALIALTLTVVGCVIGIMFAVESFDKKRVIQNGEIKTTMTTKNNIFVVKNVEFEQEINGKKTSKDMTFAIVTIEIEATKNFTIKPSNFVLSNKSAVKRDFGDGYLSKTQKIIKGDKVTLKLVFDAKYNNSTALYLYCYDCKIALGSSFGVGFFG